MSEGVELDVGGRTVTVTSPDKVFFQARGDTKLDLCNYYVAVGDAVMRQMLDRPVLLQRFPNGAHGSNFFQKRIPDGAPDWLHTTVVQTPNGTPSRALVIADLAHLVWAVNLGCLGFHSWPVRASDLEHTDELRIDLDPGPGVVWDDVGAAGLVDSRPWVGDWIGGDDCRLAAARGASRHGGSAGRQRRTGAEVGGV